jgi:hypothetical protein
MADNEANKDPKKASGELDLPPKAATDWAAHLREFTTTLIGVGITAVTLYLLYRTFHAAGETSFGDKSAVMQYGLSLVGVVLGYYFGRVPLERRVEATEKATKDANKAKEVSEKKVQEAKETVAEVKGMLAPAKMPVAKAADHEGGPTWAAYEKLDALQNRL